MPAHSRRHRSFVFWNARDEDGPRDGAIVELLNPAVCEILGRARSVPAEPMRYCTRTVRFGKLGLAGGQAFEKTAGKEMTMRVADSHLKRPIIVGLVADTHGLIRNGLFDALAGVSQILHAGDVGGRAVLDALETIAPVLAVYGNVDPLDGRLSQEVAIDVGGVSIHVSHGHELGTPTPRKLLSRYSADVLVFGHTHRALIERDGDRLVVNPGAAGPKRFDLKPSIAILRIENGRAEAEIVPVEEG